MDHNNKLKEDKKVSYKDTLNLPQTDFPIRPQAGIDDPKMIERWQQEQLYETAFKKNSGNQQYILHDGPPYANGNIHLGTAYNKILKDVVAKSQRMMGKHVPVTPGWDCHGLPIELKVTAQFPELSGPALKKQCREYASQWIATQKEQFKRLGVVMNWDHPYLTMSKEYEAATVQAFGDFVQGGYIERKNKTVPWCASCQTVLATAEIEYYDRKDPSVYVAFELTKATQEKVFPQIKEPVSLLVWTTTPWTLPLNKMVMLKPNAPYQVLKINDRLLVVGAQLADKLCTKFEVQKEVIAECNAQDLIGTNVLHPFIIGQETPVLGADLVGTDEGTACVHGAPGCGPEDYEVGVRNGIEIFSPLSTDGKYQTGILPESLVGLEVTKGHGPVIGLLQDAGNLIFKESIKHSYPHCWRCRNGLIFRATKQWFCDLSHNSLKEKALAAIKEIQFIPEATRNRLSASVSGRLEWCLSRQRTWGTPIIAAICNDCDTAFTTPEMISTVAQEIKKQGIEYWDTADLSTVLPKNACCKHCGKTNFRKEQDILDVWFDSGVSHQAVLKTVPGLSYPADLYLEGSDQHRGWFQSSLLTSVALEKQAAMKAIATHGYTVDDKGHKMSKSLGNVVAPQEMIDKMGTDGLRLWATSIDISRDATVSETLIKNVQEVFRKIRNTSRFLVSNLYDFDIKQDAIKPEELYLIDQYALQELHAFNQKVIAAYQYYDVTAVQHLFADYCASELSSFYLDIIKDRLYTDKPDGKARRSAQTVCWYILDTLTKLMAPILSFTAEQLSDCYQKEKTESIHLQNFAHVPDLVKQEAQKNYREALGHPVSTAKGGLSEQAEFQLLKEKKKSQWEALRAVREQVLKVLEQLRQKEIIKHSLEAKVTLTMNAEHPLMAPVTELLASVAATGQSKEQFLKEYFIVSDCDIIEDDIEDTESEEYTEDGEFIIYQSADAGLAVKAGHADGVKCPRCWQWEATDNANGLCHRCQQVVQSK